MRKSQPPAEAVLRPGESQSPGRWTSPVADGVAVDTFTGRLIFFLGMYALLGGALTLAGWVADVPRLTDWFNTGITQKANAAIAVMLNALALLTLALQPRLWLLGCALAVGGALMGGLTLFEHLTGIDLSIDTLLFDEPQGAKGTAAPGRMGPIASTGNLLMGAGLLMTVAGGRGRWAAHLLGVIMLVLIGTPLVGYLFGADFLYTVPRLTGIAFQATTLLLALATGLLALLPEQGLVAVLRRPDPGGMLLRRMIVPLVVLPLVLGWLELRGEQMGLYDTAFGTASLTFVLVVVLVGISTGSARRAGQAASVIAEQGERLRTTLSSIADGVIATDTRGVVTLMNGVAEALTGWRSAEAIGQPLTAVFHLVDKGTQSSLENPAARAPHEIIERATASVLIAKDGTQRPIDHSAAPIRMEDGETIGWVLTFRDVTHRKQAEQALSEAARRKDEFLATLAHELRNPLAPVSSSVEILRRPETDAETRTRIVQMMERQIKHIVRLVDDLLEVSRITRGNIALRKETVELSAVVQSALETTSLAIESAGHKLAVSLPSEPVLLEADPVRLAQVIANLLNNAAKYTEDGGHIWLTAQREENTLLLSVRDSGIGIPVEMLSRVFDLFTQIDRTLGRRQGGLGIGLTLVKQLVEMHGGTVQARSEGPGKGSEFVVRLPILSDPVPPPQRAKEERATATAAGSLRILVVDDNKDAADSMGMLLRMAGYETRIAYGGREGLESAASFQPDVVLLDIGMPEMNGFDVARRIREQPEGKALTVVAMTGWGQDEDRRRSREAGFDYHFIKPADTEELKALLASLRPRSPQR